MMYQEVVKCMLGNNYCQGSLTGFTSTCQGRVDVGLGWVGYMEVIMTDTQDMMLLSPSMISVKAFKESGH